MWFAVSLCLALPWAAGSPVAAPTNPKDVRLQDFDALGAWFDGVATITETHNRTTAETASLKSSSIAIIGGGISGLATALFLDSVGVHNWEIIEANECIGGRFRTKYVGNSTEWAEMGPMRLPYTVTYNDGETLEYTDHQMVWQLADKLNQMNQSDAQCRVDFIPWVQHHPNELIALDTRRKPDGSFPSRGDIQADSSLEEPNAITTHEYNNTKSRMDDILKNKETLKSLQRDVWRAHKRAMDQGLDEWSEQAMMRHEFKASENITDELWTSSDYDVFWDELHHNSNLGLDGSPGTPGTTEWKCIDGGFNRLSDAFLPRVQDRLKLNRKIRKLEAVQDDATGHTRTKLS